MVMGRYEIRRELGRGMMGVVYEAHDPLLHRTIALKTVSLAHVVGGKDGERFEKRFLAEARIAARLSHPGIVVVHDIGRDEASGVLFIALELLVGETLADRLAGSGLGDWKEALLIAGRVAEALAHAHSHGVIHRDIKPANIMLSRSGEPKIMDFGIARIEASDLTSPGEVFGTPLYMSPEQALGQTVDARSDLFSLGAVIYAMLIGRSPFHAPTVPAIFAQVAHKDPPPPSELLPGLPEDLDYVVARALAKDPAARYPEARALAEDVDDVRCGRPPRHRLGYEMPRRGDKTILSPRDESESPLVALLEERPATVGAPLATQQSPRRRHPSLKLLVTLGAVAGLYALLHPELISFWMTTRLSSPRSVETAPGPSLRVEIPSIPSPPVEIPSGPAPELEAPDAIDPDPQGPLDPLPLSLASSEVEAPKSVEEGGDLEDIEPPPDPEGEAQPSDLETSLSSPADDEISSVALAEPASPQPLARARLRIEFEHRIKDGWLRVWIDRKRVLSQKLESRRDRATLLFKTRKNQVRDSVRLEPGRHGIYVQVAWDLNRKKAASSLKLRLKPNDNRALVIVLRGEELKLSLY